jgi:excisionase family DNA binding protein
MTDTRRHRLNAGASATQAPPTQYLTPEEVSAVLKVPVETLYAWRKRKYGPPAGKVGRHLRYDPATVHQWFIEQTEVS